MENNTLQMGNNSPQMRSDLAQMHSDLVQMRFHFGFSDSVLALFDLRQK
jgi:hypothetical protein